MEPPTPTGRRPPKSSERQLPPRRPRQIHPFRRGVCPIFKQRMDIPRRNWGIHQNSGDIDHIDRTEHWGKKFKVKKDKRNTFDNLNLVLTKMLKTWSTQPSTPEVEDYQREVFSPHLRLTFSPTYNASKEILLIKKSMPPTYALTNLWTDYSLYNSCSAISRRSNLFLLANTNPKIPVYAGFSPG